MCYWEVYLLPARLSAHQIDIFLNKFHRIWLKEHFVFSFGGWLDILKIYMDQIDSWQLLIDRQSVTRIDGQVISLSIIAIGPTNIQRELFFCEHPFISCHIICSMDKCVIGLGQVETAKNCYCWSIVIKNYILTEKYDISL